MKEIWKKIEGHDRYSISNMGRVRNDKTGRILKTNTINNAGYKLIYIQKRCYTIHRLVALHFIPNPKGLSDVNHINEDKSDNRVENLEWLSHRDNLRHGNCRERTTEALKRYYQSEEYEVQKNIDLFMRSLFPECKTTPMKCGLPIEVDGVEYPSVSDAVEILGVSNARISQMVNEGKAKYINTLRYEWIPSVIKLKGFSRKP